MAGFLLLQKGNFTNSNKCFRLIFYQQLLFQSRRHKFASNSNDSMKRRHRYTLNLLSIGFLLFALYLNFVKKESAEILAPNKPGQSEVSHLEKASASLAGDLPTKKHGLK